jgi:hypothetical protein
MRRPLEFLGVALVACSGSSSGGAGVDGGGDGAVAQCLSGMLVLGGSSPAVPHGTYALSNVQGGTSAFSATLPAGGDIELAWSGDPTSGPVAVTGTLNLPTEGAGLTQWCIYPPSSLQTTGRAGHLQLTMQPSLGSVCSGLSGATGDAAIACFEPGP